MCVRHCASAQSNLFVTIRRFDIALRSERLPPLKKGKEKEKAKSRGSSEVNPTGSGSWSEQEKKPLSSTSCQACAGFTNGLPTRLLYTPPDFPNGSASSQQSKAVLILETRSSSQGPDSCQALVWEGPGQCGTNIATNFRNGNERKASVQPPGGFTLEAGCNCFAHFLRLVKLIHYQQQAAVPGACQWAHFLWALWHFSTWHSKGEKKLVSL